MSRPEHQGVHPTAAQGFVTPHVYERGRPDYPQAAVDALGLRTTDRVADLGCGTGKFTRQLIATGASVLGIEPLPSMLDGFRAALPGADVVTGTAEAIPCDDASFDLVACASAFHWFDHARAIPEIARVLRPGGRLAIIWNRRDELEGWSAGFFAITERHRGSTPGYRTGAWRIALEDSPSFGPITEQRFEHAQSTDLDGLLARIASISFIETLAPDARQAVLDEARDFVASHPDTAGRATFELPYRTALYTATRLPES